MHRVGKAKHVGDYGFLICFRAGAEKRLNGQAEKAAANPALNESAIIAEQEVFPCSH